LCDELTQRSQTAVARHARAWQVGPLITGLNVKDFVFDYALCNPYFFARIGRAAEVNPVDLARMTGCT
jgi:hypothetical protein